MTKPWDGEQRFLDVYDFDEERLGSVTPEPLPSVTPSRVGRPPRLELSWVDRAASACANGATAPLVDLVRASAESLSDPRARARLLAREIAIANATLDLLVAGMGERLSSGDEGPAIRLDRLATGAAKCLALLTSAQSRATVLAVTHTDVVHVDATKRRA
ncbi:MAG: hypothetical protein ACTHU0_21185 [Kofleriaceae bacterium]